MILKNLFCCRNTKTNSRFYFFSDASLHEAGAKERVRALQAPVVFLFVPRARPGAVVYCSCKRPFVSSQYGRKGRDVST